MLSYDSNKNIIWEQTEIDAGHIGVWSEVGATEIKNCQILIKALNSEKGNREELNFIKLTRF